MRDVYEHSNRSRYIRNLHCPEQATTSGTGLLLARDTGNRHNFLKILYSFFTRYAILHPKTFYDLKKIHDLKKSMIFQAMNPNYKLPWFTGFPKTRTIPVQTIKTGMLFDKPMPLWVHALLR